MELTTETIAQRLLQKNEDAGSITTGMIGKEAEHLTSSKFGLDIWLSGYYKITYTTSSNAIFQ